MTIIIPDPHPGRCNNFRSVMHNGAPTHQRCLDYATVEHICSFPSLPKPVPNGWSGQTYTQTKPKPWVKPGEVS